MNIFRKWSVYLRYTFFKVIFPFPKIISNEETLDLLINSGKSIIRYGHGEFHLLGKTEYIGCQEINIDLPQRLKEILVSDNSNCIIALPLGLNTMKGFNVDCEYFWKQFVVILYKKYIQYFDFKKTYVSVTRPDMDFKDHSCTQKFFDRMKVLWNEKKILIVEGEMSKLGVGNDLFAKSKSIHRSITLSQNAYKKYPQLLEACQALVKKYDLILISLGTTATVLDYDLCDFSIQNIDIGHVDLEYESFIARRGKSGYEW
ncbi:GT-D fold domain-containing glycosyltransferase [Sphingobacterium rhinopitheci]|uniref:GT-D fold domain-containing glycosyltransferase n=1 Tax=Sphingobacterium rhinopitheci TaxID=2781960 RepID=UPI001F523CA1|nr:GT-D fold domain-containing glycosyltransferase [Sphingobacterium rhinopitheci]MCI0920755.1 DUF1792 domain-containing protein [Sphingobacterium rhinopitheci]